MSLGREKRKSESEEALKKVQLVLVNYFSWGLEAEEPDEKCVVVKQRKI